MKRKMHFITVILLVVFISATLITGCSKTDEGAEYPEGPITMIVNYGGGGGTDISARAYAKAVEKHLDVPITVVNKEGGVGTTGIIEMLNKKPDGYTFGVATYSPVAIVPHQMDVPYVPEDFSYICGYGQYKYGIAVLDDSPFETVEDLIEAAREKDGGLSYAASGYPQPFICEKLSKLEDIELVLVPTGSGAETNTMLMGGHVPFIVAIMSDLKPFIESGEMRLLASVSGDRLEIAPDVPTLQEMGYGIEINSYLGLAAHKDVPEDRMDVLREAFEKAFDDEEFQDVMKKAQIPARFFPAEEWERICIEGYQEAEENLREMGLID
ncbi:MAG TPA: tripartite tricarboxylate transporter substrate binding protein [Thermoanaerobacterales bacterium]|nr:tripartite tricarboxylate transporter substrate binding protein [Thermoanaerobacterales bacterium]